MRLEPGEIVAEKYRIERPIGEGGMGTVYAATNQLTGRSVALKWLRADLAANSTFTERMMREARVAGRLDHPNIVNVYDVGRYGDSVFLVMELLRGESFDSWLRSGPHPAGDCIALLMPALRAVAAAHAVGVVHRDLKPDNIFLCKDPEGSIRGVKVLDFGIAKVLGEDDPANSLTNPGSIVGTIHYMAPEHVRNSRLADARSDVYALGVILYHSLGGDLPFDAESLGELILEITDGNAEPLSKRRPDLPKPLCDVVMKAMAYDPADRFQSVSELALALEPFSSGVKFAQTLVEYAPSTRIRSSADTKAAAPVETMASPQPRKKRPVWPFFAGAVALLGVTSFVLLSGPLGAGGSSADLETPAATPAAPPPLSPAPETERVAPTPAPPAPEPVVTADPTVTASVTPPPSASAAPEPAPVVATRAPKRPAAAAKPKASASAAPASSAEKPAPAKTSRSVFEQNPYLRH